MSPTPDDLHARLYRSLYRIRRTEEEIARIYPSDKIKSPVHLSIGQESVSVGVCEALQPDDAVFGTYRGHALYLAKGGDLRGMLAELYGKATGCARGKGGSMHLIDPAAKVMGTSAVVGTTIPHAVGYAYALKVRHSDAVVVSFFGDGAAEEGVFHESLNFAALKKLPILFVCENNDYAIYSCQQARQPIDNIFERGRIYGIPGERIEGTDVLVIHERAKQLVEKVRGGFGPILMECRTYRWRDHVGPDEDLSAAYRDPAEASAWVGRDVVRDVAESLLPDERARIEAEVKSEVQDAIDFAERSPFPDESDLYTHLFAEA